MYPISKVIHFMWFQGFETIPYYLAAIPDRWAKLNPDYQILKWDFSNLSVFIQQHYPQFFTVWNSISSVIKRCDFARLLILHHFGGVYVDCDLVPQRPLSSMLGSDRRYCQTIALVRRLPVPYQEEPYDFAIPELILSREHRPIDPKGFGIANGIIFAKPQCAILLDFLTQQYLKVKAPVLLYLGPHALTRFIRANSAKLKGRVGVVSPYYFLWEEAAMSEAAPPWNISVHLARNHWGDHSKKDWWNVI